MKDRTVQALKGLAIIGVVLFHITNRRFDQQVIGWMHDIIILFGWCVLGFFCVSGYVQALSDSRKNKSVLEFTRNRFQRLLIPFFILVFVYSCLWQVVQAFHVGELGKTVPPGFLAKLEQAVWPVDSQVAQQLYFFPLLFGISLVLIVVQKRLGLYGMWTAAVVGFAVGTAFYPNNFTGFNGGVFLWGIGFYSAGYLLFHHRNDVIGIRMVLFVVTLLLMVFNGEHGLIRCIPLWLLAEGHALRFDRLPLLGRLGDASGTIYIYHTPFIIQPLVIAATLLPGAPLQFTGALLAAAVAIAICCAIYEGLKNTRAKVLLM
jgi:acyltransferase